MSAFLRALSPNTYISGGAAQALFTAWAVLLLLTWWMYPSVLVPNPGEVFLAIGSVWQEGLLYELLISFKTYGEALAITALISMGLAYATVMPIMRPPVTILTKSRFLSMAGLTFMFTLATGGGHWLKVALLVFGMSVFTLDAMTRMVEGVTQEQYNHARTLRMSEWRAVWEVVIRGKADQALDILRQNAAMGWMMIGMVEGLVRSEGGVGSMLLNATKHFHMADVFAIQITILILGLIQDWFIGVVRVILFPYADLRVERK